MDLVDLIKEKGYKGYIYPSVFPNSSDMPCTVVSIGSSPRRRGRVFDVPITVVSRDIHPRNSEEVNADIKNSLDMLTDVMIGDARAISIIADSPVPVYSGRDENDLYYHTSNLVALIDY